MTCHTREEMRAICDVKVGKACVYHGTSYRTSLDIARLGFFGSDPETNEHPTLACSPDDEAVWTAIGREEDGYGAIVELVCEDDEFQALGMGGMGDKVGVPAKRFNGIRARLERILPKHLYDDPGLKHIAPERVSKIILIKKTEMYPA